MDEQRRQQRFEELANEAAILFSETLRQAIESDDYLKIKKALAEECGVEVVGHQIELNMLVEQKEIVGSRENNAHGAANESIELNHQIKLGDDIIAHSLGIKIEPEEINELETNLEKARKERSGLDRPKEIANLQIKSETDPRDIGQIINDLMSAARKLDLKSRQTVAKIINVDLGLHISTSDQLANNTFWLQQIQTAINRLRELSGAQDKFKALLMQLEIIIKSGGIES